MNIVICNSLHWFTPDNEIVANHNILTLHRRDDLTLRALEEFAADLVFFPHWNWIVSDEVFQRFQCIVFHTAPLPYGRGGSPIQNLIKRGHRSSPVCALKMSKGIDDGPIYDREHVILEGTLTQILARLNTAVNAIMRRLVNRLPDPLPQAGDVTTFSRLGHADNEISGSATLQEFYDAIRMLDDPSYPNSYLKLDKVYIEFSNILKEKNSLTCQVKIYPREIEK